MQQSINFFFQTWKQSFDRLAFKRFCKNYLVNEVESLIFHWYYLNTPKTLSNQPQTWNNGAVLFDIALQLYLNCKFPFPWSGCMETDCYLKKSGHLIKFCGFEILFKKKKNLSCFVFPLVESFDIASVFPSSKTQVFRSRIIQIQSGSILDLVFFECWINESILCFCGGVEQHECIWSASARVVFLVKGHFSWTVKNGT